MVKCVLYVEKEKFLRSLFEVALRAKKQEIHTIDSLQNNIYLLNDLNPALIILDWATVQNSPELQSVLDFKKTNPSVKIIVTGPTHDIPFKADGFFTKPIEVNQLAQKIMSLID